ncbi:MAG: hypothetical protein CR990_00425 [Desulfococcus sp.]|nr:MAG: hypothetical protein CR990_00425 [Desulfococcus sp.]
MRRGEVQSKVFMNAMSDQVENKPSGDGQAAEKSPPGTEIFRRTTLTGAGAGKRMKQIVLGRRFI